MYRNRTVLSEFFLIGIQTHNVPSRILFFAILLFVYTTTVTGDFLIFVLVSTSQRLQHPMYFFIKQLSLSEIVFTTNIIPNMLGIILLKGGVISFVGCISQFYIYIASGSVESLLLTVMSYDRYLAICHPLQYTYLMGLQLCRNLTFLCWTSCFSLVLITIILICRLDFCGPNVIDHYFCDFAPLVELACSDTTILRMEVIVLSIPIVLSTFLFIIVSYIRISTAILKISSNNGRQKAFSTCSAHLASVCSYYGPLVVIYLVPYRKNSLNVNKFLSILYTVGTPFFNPLIYSLRNHEIRDVWRKYFNVAMA
ncbi:olfactory receptor 6N1-like [Spea bombifrons]|uniref:olfactory receptor 6N1-like n=1 Tax=Spea bombifrons TaxID=233779 RepID=UPI002349F7FD|nr:olfactory receptor 6N1-like [Spea bombifrons]